MKRMARICLLLGIGVCAGCTAHSTSGPCGPCGYDRPQSYREPVHDPARNDFAGEYHDQSQFPPPARDADPKRPAVGSGAAPAVTYTCPMHPEIVQPSPGRCPQCGMELVAK
jgi:hypothetical protein